MSKDLIFYFFLVLGKKDFEAKEGSYCVSLRNSFPIIIESCKEKQAAKRNNGAAVKQDRQGETQTWRSYLFMEERLPLCPSRFISPFPSLLFTLFFIFLFSIYYDFIFMLSATRVGIHYKVQTPI